MNLLIFFKYRAIASVKSQIHTKTVVNK